MPENRIIKMIQEKAHQHDCDACIYLGGAEMNGDKYDLYICEGTYAIEHSCFIARYGADERYITRDYERIDENDTNNLFSLAKRLYLARELESV